AVAVRVHARGQVAETAPDDVSGLTRAARDDLYGDRVNEALFMRPGQAAVAGTAVVDRAVVSGAALGVAAAVGAGAARRRPRPSALTRSSALCMLLGAALTVAARRTGGVL